MFLKIARPKFNCIASFDPITAIEIEKIKETVEWQRLRQQKQASHTSFPEMSVPPTQFHVVLTGKIKRGNSPTFLPVF